jgi:hypothetical protein
VGVSINWDNYVFIDTETGGLDFRQHPLLEMTYAVGLNEPKTLYVEDLGHVLVDCDPIALQVNHIIDRFMSHDDTGQWWDVPVEFRYEDNPQGINRAWLDLPEPADKQDWEEFADAIKGKTWVGANPGFDVNFIQEYLYPDIRLQHHYHLFDIRSWWKGINGSIDMKTKEDIPHFEDIPEMKYLADHTSLGDVRAMREAWAYHVIHKHLF